MPSQEGWVFNSLRVSSTAASRADQRVETVLEGRVLLPQQFDQQPKIKTGLMDSNVSWANGQGGLGPRIKAKIPVLTTQPWSSKSGVRGIFCLQEKGEVKRDHHMWPESAQRDI